MISTLKNTTVENIVGKGENAGDQHFLLFPQCFQYHECGLNEEVRMSLTGRQNVDKDCKISRLCVKRVIALFNKIYIYIYIRDPNRLVRRALFDGLFGFHFQHFQQVM